MQPGSVTIGIHVWEDPASLRRTLDAIAGATLVPHRVLLLGDGADAGTTAAMDASGLPQSSTPVALGAPACFNRLTGSDDADVFVFLESGCLPAQGWLDALLAALDADPHNALAGPSTNLSWNEQAQCPDSNAALRRAGEFRTLEPLYSLADFCYAVKRGVVAAIGGADERYGLGPCWEMDYNIRAARAGFRGVWACGAFVLRQAPGKRRRAEEGRLFQSNKHLYQDKFCSLRRNQSRPYEPHCRGDECEHFAPAELIQLTKEHPPELLVSCVMVTRGRPDYVAQSVGYFERQTWKNRELIIVYDEPGDLPPGLAPTIRTFRLPGHKTIGEKRNYGCTQARGEIVAQWDDDDWYGPDRLRLQAEPIARGMADITGLRTPLFFELDSWRFWTCNDALHARIFVRNVHGGTLVYRRTVWESRSRYPNASLAEDAYFLENAVRNGARLHRIDEPGIFIYLRHPTNSWRFQCGEFTDPKSWTLTTEPECLGADRDFYRARTSQPVDHRYEVPAIVGFADRLVTCIMPTADRLAFVPHAIEYFQRQHYPEKELLILDDGRSSAEHLVPPGDPRIRYVRLDKRLSIGAKRNMACALAKGEVILHWDDDDWMAEWRISYQVQALLRAPEDSVWGLDKVLFFDPRQDRAWLYVYPHDAPSWVAGGTLCYRKTVVERFPFPDISEGEDTRFVWSLPPGNLRAHPDYTFMVAMIHPANTSPKMTADRRWQPHPVEEIRRLMRANADAVSAEPVRR